MRPSGSFELLTIGHSNLAADRFIELLKGADVTTIADVRSVPFSRWCPWFSRRPLAKRLAREAIGYVELGDALGGRPRDPRLYRDGVADYDAMAHAADFRAGLGRLREMMDRGHACIMCAEREPLDCHRCLLIARVLTEQSVAIGHILGDGTIEPHTATEQRLLAVCGGDADLFGDRAGRLAEAYRRRNRGMAARVKS